MTGGHGSGEPFCLSAADWSHHGEVMVLAQCLSQCRRLEPSRRGYGPRPVPISVPQTGAITERLWSSPSAYLSAADWSHHGEVMVLAQCLSQCRRLEPSRRDMMVTVPFIGRLHLVRDSGGVLQVAFVLAYWMYGSFTTLFIILLPQYHDGRIPYSIIVSYMAVSVLCLLSLVKASLTNPGRVPLDSEASALDTSDWTFCKVCDRKRPKRAHHCRRCRQCVMRMDHHCPWINNCVGEDNHFAFTLLLLYSFLLGTFSLALTILHFWVWPKCTSCDRDAFYIKHSIWLVYLLVLLAFNMSLLMFLQLSYLHSNVLADRTTLENMQIGGMVSGQELKLRRMYSAYRDLCGRGPMLCWLWPYRRRVPVIQPHAPPPV
ncbi:hypothetical protein ACOMHN_001644 [Nucella lapillus]